MPELTRKIAFEEHFLAPDFYPNSETMSVEISPELFGRAFGALRDLATAGRRSRMRQVLICPS